MNHLDEDTLLLYAYGEIPEDGTPGIEVHLGACPDCRRALEAIERGRVLTEGAMEGRASGRRWIVPAAAVTLAAAAAGIIVLGPGDGGSDAGRAFAWSPREWSVPAGYFAGGPDLVAIDSILSRLEQEVAHVGR